ncbi:MAG TPA: dolichyl-phosphate beta-glucosyltransferase [Chloroflexia bacterium]|nr:dolichyl-phosphate beta-glucosyltransferase [Chloroflexia bacterium]
MDTDRPQGKTNTATGQNEPYSGQALEAGTAAAEESAKTNTDNIFLTVVIPAYNEQVRLSETLHRVLSWLEEQSFTSEVLVVDDGSEDATASVVQKIINERELAEKNGTTALCRLRLIINDHRGKGYAVRTGMLEGRGRYILFSDADLSTPISEASKLLAWFDQGYQVAIGSREGKDAHRYNEPGYRHFMGRVFNLLVRMVTFSPFQDTQCGFKAFTREAARDIFKGVQLYGENSHKVTGAMVTGFDVEVLFLASKRGYRVREVPVQWYHVEGSKVSPLKDSVRNALDVLKVRVNDLRGLYRKKS